MTKGYVNVWKNCLTLYLAKISEFQKVNEFCMVFSELPFMRYVYLYYHLKVSYMMIVAHFSWVFFSGQNPDQKSKTISLLPSIVYISNFLIRKAVEVSLFLYKRSKQRLSYSQIIFCQPLVNCKTIVFKTLPHILSVSLQSTLIYLGMLSFEVHNSLRYAVQEYKYLKISNH